MTVPEFNRMVAGFYRRQDAQWLHTREIIAAVYNASANRDFKKPGVKGADIYPVGDERTVKLKVKWKPSKKSRGAIELPPKKLAALNERFNQ
ncbi:hypothetical protein GCM10027299_21570 [Larkinella ripae]